MSTISALVYQPSVH